jgi:hypothetical protein
MWAGSGVVVAAALAVGGVLIGSPAGAATSEVATPSAAVQSAFVAKLGTDQKTKYTHLSRARQTEVTAFFSDHAVATGALSAKQIKAKYPDAVITDTSQTTITTAAIAPAVSTQNASGPLVLAAAAATVYNVHSWFSHTQSILFISNTSTNDYYYQTQSNRVISNQNCTWRDSGLSANHIANISTNMWVSGGQGHCNATVQISEFPYFVWNDSLVQNMVVNGTNVTSTYFHQTG